MITWLLAVLVILLSVKVVQLLHRIDSYEAYKQRVQSTLTEEEARKAQRTTLYSYSLQMCCNTDLPPTKSEPTETMP